MAKSMSLLWGAGSPPCWRVRIMLEEKKLQGYKHRLLSFEKGQHKSQEVLDVNPRGQLPAFKHGDNILNESVAACLYLEEERHDSAMKKNKEALLSELKLWEGYLEKVSSGSYLAGGFSLADVTVFPSVAFAFRFGLSVGSFPKLAKYYSLLKDRASIKASWPPHWVATPHGYDILKDL